MRLILSIFLDIIQKPIPIVKASSGRMILVLSMWYLSLILISIKLLNFKLLFVNLCLMMLWYFLLLEILNSKVLYCLIQCQDIFLRCHLLLVKLVNYLSQRLNLLRELATIFVGTNLHLTFLAVLLINWVFLCFFAFWEHTFETEVI